MNKKPIVALLLITAALGVCFGLPKPHYESPNILPSLKGRGSNTHKKARLRGWRSRAFC